MLKRRIPSIFLAIVLLFGMIMTTGCNISLTGSVVIAGQGYNINLTALDLSGQNLTSSDIEQIRYMENLRYLDLSNNQISDISPLKDLSNLEELFLEGNPINREQIEELKVALPGLRIYD